MHDLALPAFCFSAAPVRAGSGRGRFEKPLGACGALRRRPPTSERGKIPAEDGPGPFFQMAGLARASDLPFFL